MRKLLIGILLACVCEAGASNAEVKQVVGSAALSASAYALFRIDGHSPKRSALYAGAAALAFGLLNQLAFRDSYSGDQVMASAAGTSLGIVAPLLIEF